MKNYIILGNNNYWYSFLNNATEEELEEKLKHIKHYCNDYNNEIDLPTELYVYEVVEKVKTIQL